MFIIFVFKNPEIVKFMCSFNNVMLNMLFFDSLDVSSFMTLRYLVCNFYNTYIITKLLPYMYIGIHFGFKLN